MSEQFGAGNRCDGGYRPHMGMFIPFVIPLAIGFMLGMRKGMMHQGMHHRMGMGPGKNWENGVPPFFAELHRRAHAAENQPAAEQPTGAEA